MISKISATHNTIVMAVNVYIAMRKMVFSKCSGTMHFMIVNFSRETQHHIGREVLLGNQKGESEAKMLPLLG